MFASGRTRMNKRMLLPLTAAILVTVFYPVTGRIDVSEIMKTKNWQRKLLPKDLGLIHNHVVMKVHDRLEKKIPANQNEYLNMVFDEVSILCDEEDTSCKKELMMDIAQSRLAVKELFMLTEKVDIDSMFPEEISDEMKIPFKEIVDSIYLINDHGHEEVIGRIEKIASEVEFNTTDAFIVDAVQAVASIAVGSTQLWTEAQKDPNNAFYKIHAGSNNRHLKPLIATGVDILAETLFGGANLITNVISFVLSDVVGAIKGAIIPGVLTLIGIAKPSFLFAGVLRLGILDSLSAIGIRIPNPIDIALCIISLSIKDCSWFDFPIPLGDLFGFLREEGGGSNLQQYYPQSYPQQSYPQQYQYTPQDFIPQMSSQQQFPQPQTSNQQQFPQAQATNQQQYPKPQTSNQQQFPQSQMSYQQQYPQTQTYSYRGYYNP